MATAWSQATSELIRSALENMGVIGPVDPVSAEDSDTCLRVLNGLLKELPVYGYQWPEYREGQALTWSNVTPSTVVLPADFYGFPFVRRADGVPLVELSPAEWGQIDTTTRAQTAEKPTHFYQSGASLMLWPIPTATPGLTLNYQSKISDAVGATAPDMPQSWLNALPWGIADECGLRYQVPPEERAEISAKWERKKAYLLASAAPTGPVDFSVAD